MPSDRDVKKKRLLMILFWLLVCVNWVSYTVSNIYYTVINDFVTLQLVTFCETIFLTVFILMTSLFFSVAFYRIYQLNKQLGDQEGNSK